MISTQSFSKQRLERQKGQQWADDKPLPEIGQIAPEPMNNIQSQTALQN
jgi:hypothetical protein